MVRTTKIIEAEVARHTVTVSSYNGREEKGSASVELARTSSSVGVCGTLRELQQQIL